jgi:ribosomal protein S18 acetylase RimI-like enzyme
MGELTELSETHLTVATIRGKIRVPLDEVHRGKRIPDLAGLERAASQAMPAVVVKQLGDWQLRAAEGFTGRANSALPLGDPGLPFSEAVTAVVDFYAEQGLPAQFDVPLPLGRPVARRLAELGWEPGQSVLVRAIDLPDLVAATPTGAEFSLADRPSEQMLEMIKGRRGVLPAAAAHVLTAVPQLAFAGYEEGGVLLGMARGTVTSRWLGLTFIETVEQARRRGLARGAIGSLARWAQRLGATRAFLQVSDNNTAALALYDALGFRAHHWYTRYTRRG